MNPLFSLFYNHLIWASFRGTVLLYVTLGYPITKHEASDLLFSKVVIVIINPNTVKLKGKRECENVLEEVSVVVDSNFPRHNIS